MYSQYSSINKIQSFSSYKFSQFYLDISKLSTHVLFQYIMSSTPISSQSNVIISHFRLNNICSLIPIRLDSTNYVHWKFQIFAIPNDHTLFAHLDHEIIPCPDQFLTPPTIVQPESIFTPLHRQKNSSSVFSHITSVKTACELWIILEKWYSSKIRSSMDYGLFCFTLQSLRSSKDLSSRWSLWFLWNIQYCGKQKTYYSNHFHTCINLHVTFTSDRCKKYISSGQETVYMSKLVEFFDKRLYGLK